MRHVLATVLITGLAAMPVLAQDAAPAQPAKVAVTKPTDFVDADRTNDAIKKALDQLVKTNKAYRQAPAITELIGITALTPMGEQKQQIESAWGPDGAYRISMDGGAMSMISDGKKIFLSLGDSPNKYMEMPIDPENPLATLMMVTGGGGLPDPAIPFRLDTATVTAENMASRLAMGNIPEPRILGYRMNGKTPQILIEGQGSSNIVSINPANNLISRCDLNLLLDPRQPDMRISVIFDYNAKVLDKLPEAIAFDTEGKTMVSTPEELQPEPIKVGDMAPNFTLADLDGNTVELSSLRGEVVVLDFWATWCGPCKRGLPSLDKVAKWVTEENLPVKVYAVNTMERGSEEQRTKVARMYWEQQKFSFPTLMDLTDISVSEYGLRGIPATFVIGRDGKILNFHGGFAPGMDEQLKKEITAAVSEKG